MPIVLALKSSKDPIFSTLKLPIGTTFTPGGGSCPLIACLTSQVARVDIYSNKLIIIKRRHRVPRQIISYLMGKHAPGESRNSAKIAYFYYLPSFRRLAQSAVSNFYCGALIYFTLLHHPPTHWFAFACRQSSRCSFDSIFTIFIWKWEMGFQLNWSFIRKRNNYSCKMALSFEAYDHSAMFYSYSIFSNIFIKNIVSFP